jgi:hypothetical protein
VSDTALQVGPSVVSLASTNGSATSTPLAEFAQFEVQRKLFGKPVLVIDPTGDGPGITRTTNQVSKNFARSIRTCRYAQQGAPTSG